MIIDSHVHVRPCEQASPDDIYAPVNILKLMDEFQIEKAMVFPNFGLMPDNRGLAKVVRRYADRFIGFAWLNPHAGQDAANELEELVGEHGFRGVKLHPLLHAFFPRHNGLALVMKKVEALKIPVTIHCGHAPFSLPWQIAEIAEVYPDVKIILDHMGLQLGYVDESIRLAQKHPNLYLGTTAMPFHLKIKEAVDKIGSERIIFGSDSPVIHPLPEIERVRVAGLSPEDQEMVLGGSLAKLLQI